MTETFASLFDHKALQMGGKEVILFLRKGRLESKITYSSLQQISNRVANGLMEMGLRKGERVILFMPKSIEQVAFHLGVQKVRAISVILNPGFKKDEMDYFLKDTEAKIIISGGENISPKEIESVIDHHQKILESCVVGVPDEKWGEKVVVAVVLKPGVTVTAKEVRDYCKDHLLDWKCPKEVFFLKELPRNKMGKVMKEEVVRLFFNLFPPRTVAP